jgi:hypothetical protein
VDSICSDGEREFKLVQDYNYSRKGSEVTQEYSKLVTLLTISDSSAFLAPEVTSYLKLSSNTSLRPHDDAIAARSENLRTIAVRDGMWAVLRKRKHRRQEGFGCPDWLTYLRQPM